MMSEINTHDTLENSNPRNFEYTNIKPETNMTPKEAREQWDTAMSRKTEIGSELSNVKDAKADGDNERNSIENGRENSESNPTHISTKLEAYESTEYPTTGVMCEKRVLQMPNGDWIEGVFPKFASKFDAKLPKSMYLDSYQKHFKECNRQLSEAIEKDPDLKSQFTDEQIEQIKDGVKDGSAPDGYVWHHDVESGKMQLVDAEQHAKTPHRGGKSLWGSEMFNR